MTRHNDGEGELFQGLTFSHLPGKVDDFRVMLWGETIGRVVRTRRGWDAYTPKADAPVSAEGYATRAEAANQLAGLYYEA